MAEIKCNKIAYVDPKTTNKVTLTIPEVTEGGDIIIPDATDSTKGGVILSDAIDGSQNAATGKTAATPKAVADAVNSVTTTINETVKNEITNIVSGGEVQLVPDATDVVKGSVLLTDTPSDLSAATGATALSPKALNDYKTENDAKIGSLDDLTTTSKDNLVAAINEIKSTGGSGGAVETPDATDSVKGKTQLSDAIDSDSNAATGVTAATPLAVKSVNTKIGDLSLLSTEDKSNIVNALNETLSKVGSGEGGSTAVTATDKLKGISKLSDEITSSLNAESGGTAATPYAVSRVNKKIEALIDQGGTGSSSLVLTPRVIIPADGAVDQLQSLSIIGTSYRNVFSDDVRDVRTFQISTSESFDSLVVEKEVNSDSYDLEQLLDKSTKYFVRIKDTSLQGFVSQWSPVVSFTTGSEESSINTPTITLKGYNNSTSDFTDFVNITSSEFAVTGSIQDTHKSTSWVVQVSAGGNNVFESLNDTEHLTSISVPEGTLQPGVTYRVNVTYHGNILGSSNVGTVEFTTSNDFGKIQTPSIMVSGAPDGITVTPVITGSAFFNTRDGDKHVQSDWLLYTSLDPSGTPIYQSLNDTNNLTSLTVPSDTLEVDSNYIVKLRYKGERLGWSEFGEATFHTANSVATIATPPAFSITGEADGAVVKLAYMAAGPFFPTSETENLTDTHQYTDWQIFKTSNLESPIWESLNSTGDSLLHIQIPDGTLEENTEYLFRVRFKGTKYGWSNYAEKTLKTVEHWNDDPYNGICPNVLTEGIHFVLAKAVSNANYFYRTPWTPSSSDFTVLINGEPKSGISIYNITANADDEILIKSNGTKFPIFNCNHTTTHDSIKEFKEPLPTVYNSATTPVSVYRYLFYYQTALESISDNLLANNPGITVLQDTFFSENTSFKNVAYNRVWPVIGTFQGKLSAIPESMFKYSTCLTCISSMFAYQKALKAIPEKLFKYTPILQIIWGCYSGNTLIKNYVSNSSNSTTFYAYNEGLFSFNTALTDVPSNLFAYNPCIITVDSTFLGCTGLINITGTNILGYKPVLICISNMFAECSALQSIPDFLFNSSDNSKGLFSGKNFSKNYLLSGNYSTQLKDTECRSLFYKAIIDNFPEKALNGLAFTHFTNTFYGIKVKSIEGSVFKYTPITQSIQQPFNSSTHTDISNNFPENLYKGCTYLSFISYPYTDDNIRFVSNIPDGVFSGLENLRFLHSVFSFFTNITKTGKNHFVGCTKLEYLNGVFNNCSKLKEIESSLLDGATNLKILTELSSGCSALTVISQDLFIYTPNLKELNSLFVSCTLLETTPDYLFKDLTKVTKLFQLFKDCTSLSHIGRGFFKNCSSVTKCSYVFYNTAITSVEEDLFWDMVNVTYLQYTFTNSKLESIPQNLLRKCKKLISIENLFQNNLIKEIPIDFLKYNYNLENMAHAFKGCKELITVPLDTLKYNLSLEHIQFAFYDCIKLNPTVKIGSKAIQTADFFGYNCLTGGIVYVVPSSPTYTNIRIANNTNVNVVVDNSLTDIEPPVDPDDPVIENVEVS